MPNFSVVTSFSVLVEDVATPEEAIAQARDWIHENQEHCNPVDEVLTEEELVAVEKAGRIRELGPDLFTASKEKRR